MKEELTAIKKKHSAEIANLFNQLVEELHQNPNLSHDDLIKVLAHYHTSADIVMHYAIRASVLCVKTNIVSI